MGYHWKDRLTDLAIFIRVLRSTWTGKMFHFRKLASDNCIGLQIPRVYEYFHQFFQELDRSWTSFATYLTSYHVTSSTSSCAQRNRVQSSSEPGSVYQNRKMATTGNSGTTTYKNCMTIFQNIGRPLSFQVHISASSKPNRLIPTFFG